MHVGSSEEEEDGGGGLPSWRSAVHVEERMMADLVDDNTDGQWAPKFDADGSRRPMSMGAETGDWRPIMPSWIVYRRNRRRWWLLMGTRRVSNRS